MPLEKEGYRDQLERLTEAFPGKEVLTAKEVAQFLGRDVRTVRENFSFKKAIGISIVQLARELLP